MIGVSGYHMDLNGIIRAEVGYSGSHIQHAPTFSKNRATLDRLQKAIPSLRLCRRVSEVSERWDMIGC